MTPRNEPRAGRASHHTKPRRSTDYHGPVSHVQCHREPVRGCEGWRRYPNLAHTRCSSLSFTSENGPLTQLHTRTQSPPTAVNRVCHTQVPKLMQITASHTTTRSGDAETGVGHMHGPGFALLLEARGTRRLGSRFCTKNRISEGTSRVSLPYLAAIHHDRAAVFTGGSYYSFVAFWPDWDLRKLSSAHKTSNPARRARRHCPRTPRGSHA